ncbi:MAG: tetratricopeptide repeat protein [Rikenellaceae bacterium]|nr:tetratricopeptide repeat protein [Rikenellaceae bacterium]
MAKRIIFSFVFAFAALFVYAQADTEELWNRANDAYAAGEYDTAVELYDSIASQGLTSYKLYYNLGNAYFKNGQIGKAILYYNKAQLIAPYNSDIEHNLEIANGYVRDRIEAVPEFFLKKWVRSVKYGMSSNMWGVVSLIMFALMLASILCYLLSGKIAVRKSGFYTGILSLAVFIITVIFATNLRRGIENPPYAIVISSSASVKSSPDTNSKDLFILHEGTKVKIVERLGEWREITIADGNKGWIAREAIEPID